MGEIERQKDDTLQHDKKRACMQSRQYRNCKQFIRIVASRNIAIASNSFVLSQVAIAITAIFCRNRKNAKTPKLLEHFAMMPLLHACSIIAVPSSHPRVMMT